MTDEELEHRLTAVENRAQSNTHRLDVLGLPSSCGEGCVFTVKFQLAAPTRPILGFAHALFRAVEQINLVQSGTLAQFHDLNTQVPHGLGCAGVFHAF